MVPGPHVVAIVLCFNLIKENQMKCVKNTDGKVERVGEELATKRVNSGEWQYCGKQEWKAKTRKKE